MQQYWANNGWSLLSLKRKHFRTKELFGVQSGKLYIDSLTSRHFSGEGMRTCFSLVQSRYNIPMGFLSGTFSTNIRSVVYFSNDEEKNGTSRKHKHYWQIEKLRFEKKVARGTPCSWVFISSKSKIDIRRKLSLSILTLDDKIDIRRKLSLSIVTLDDKIDIRRKLSLLIVTLDDKIDV